MMLVSIDIRRFESAMAEHPDRRESSDRGRSSTSEYGYIGSSTKTGREESVSTWWHFAGFLSEKGRKGDTDDSFKHSYGSGLNEYEEKSKGALRSGGGLFGDALSVVH